jgi:hypothetical protein
MPTGQRLVLIPLLALAAALSLSGCATSGPNVGDVIPQWAGGLPADAPPRPGTAKYDEFMRERERRRELPASERDKLPPADPAASPPSSAGARQ